MKYINTHLQKPEIDQLIYWFGPNGKDILGWFRGKLTYEEYQKEFPWFVPKWWYPAEPGLVPDPKYQEDKPLKIKRQYTKRKNIEKKSKKNLEK